MKRLIIFLLFLASPLFGQYGQGNTPFTFTSSTAAATSYDVTFTGSTTFTGTVSFSAAVTISSTSLLVASDGDSVIADPGTAASIFRINQNGVNIVQVDTSGQVKIDALNANPSLIVNGATAAILGWRIADVRKWSMYIDGSNALSFEFFGSDKIKILSNGIYQSNFSALTLGVGATTFAATANYMIITGDAGANTVATITGFSASFYGELFLEFVDGLVTITDTDDAGGANTVDLSAAFTSANDTILHLVWNGTNWKEVSRSAN